MNNRTRSLSVSLLSLAVTSLLWAPASSLAAGGGSGTPIAGAPGSPAEEAAADAGEPEAPEGGSFEISTSTVDKAGEERTAEVTRFTDRLVELMNAPGTALYLRNSHLADSSTFPFRLLELQKRNVWRPAPAHGIPARDLGAYYGVPPYRKPQDFDTDTTPVVIESDSVTGDLKNRGDDLIYRGRVVVTQGDRELTTDTLRYEGRKQTLTATGSSVISAPEYTVATSEPVTSDLAAKTLTLRDSRLQLNGSYLRGEAREHVIDQRENSHVFKTAYLTSCPIDDNSWKVSATSLWLDQDEDFGESWNNLLYVGSVPIFYFPYTKFATSNERRSGLLFPELSFASDGVFFGVPVYFNLAPNYDWTFTPRWAGDHRWQLGNEFRFMPFENLSGSLVFDYLPDDPTWTSDSDNHRWFLNLKENLWFLDRDLTFTLNYARVRPNDYDYIDDVLDTKAAVTEDHLIQSLKGAYNIRDIDISLEVRKYQSLINPTARVVTPFALMPQLKAGWADTRGSLLMSVDAEFSRFHQDGQGDYGAFSSLRTHIEPAVKYHIFDQRGTTLDAGARLFYTHYDQSHMSDLPAYYRTRLGYSDIDSSVDRMLYLLELRGKTTFERKIIDMSHTQTLEPEVKYQYIPYKNQNNIALYDTTDRLDDYYTLFSYRRFAGLDRIANLNTLSLGLTSRILDSHDREILRVGIAQAYNFEPTKVTLNSSDQINDYPRSPLAFMLDSVPFEHVRFHVSGTYNTEDAEMSALRTALRYEDSGFLAGISYRFIREGNVEIGGSDKIRDLNQIGGELRLPLGGPFKFIAAAYHDMEQNYDVDKKLALRYENTCLAITLVYEDYMKMNWKKRQHVSEKVIGAQIEFKGLYALGVHGIENPFTTGTHYIPSTDPVSLNR